jgi:hypothetical protein
MPTSGPSDGPVKRKRPVTHAGIMARAAGRKRAAELRRAQAAIVEAGTPALIPTRLARRNAVAAVDVGQERERWRAEALAFGFKALGQLDEMAIEAPASVLETIPAFAALVKAMGGLTGLGVESGSTTNIALVVPPSRERWGEG